MIRNLEMEQLQPNLIPEETDEMPVLPYRVLHADVPFFSDPECKNEVTDAKIVILEPLDPSDKVRELDIVPSSKEYRPGQLLTWRLNNKKIWNESWYRHPETGQIERAWTAHVEFVGWVISQSSIERHRAHLDQIERKLRAQQLTADN